ncbi:TadE family type IV pilus minor pilin [Arthrobacter sp. TMN-37]
MSRHLRSGRAPERGAVTAELAVALPALVLLLGAFLGAASIGVVQLRLEEAARAGAREVVRGEAAGSVAATVRSLAGPGADVELAGDGRWTSVTVSSKVHGPFLDLMEVRLSATASGWSEHAR